MLLSRKLDWPSQSKEGRMVLEPFMVKREPGKLSRSGATKGAPGVGLATGGGAPGRILGGQGLALVQLVMLLRAVQFLFPLTEIHLSREGKEIIVP